MKPNRVGLMLANFGAQSMEVGPRQASYSLTKKVESRINMCPITSDKGSA